MEWECDNCRCPMEGDEQYYCVICGAVVCESCISDDLDVCNECN